MDVPASDILESASDALHARHARNVLPELSRQQTVFVYANGAAAAPTLDKRKSFRLRPTESFEQDAVPPRPLRTLKSQPDLRTPKSQPDLRPRASAKMSLFSLFSKPKVEKHRGSAEPGLSSTPSSAGTGSNKELTSTAHGTDAKSIKPQPKTVRSHSRAGYRMRSKDSPPPVPAIPSDQKLRLLEALPLFQIWPQAIRHGIFQSPTLSPQELLLQKHRSAAVPLEPSDKSQENNVDSTETTDAQGTAPKAMLHGSAALRSEESHERLFILVTSGCLLQYAATGSSERMPEKILQLGKDSAAYASDLIPGRYHVLEVSQAVDANGETVAGSSSIFSRLTIRSAAARRATAKLLLIMPGASEMEEWMAAIRKEIHWYGGKLIHSNPSSQIGPRTGGSTRQDALPHEPSQMHQLHRYQVKRDPARVVSVISTGGNTSDVPLNRDMQVSRLPAVETEEEIPAEVVGGSVEDRPRSASDADSTGSSTTHSVEQHTLNQLRDSTRVSHTSVATTVTNSSRTSSMTLDQPKLSSESASHRNMSAYGLVKRRSAVPIAINDIPSRPGAAFTNPSPPRRVSALGTSAPAVRPPSAERIRTSLVPLSMAQNALAVNRSGRQEFNPSSQDSSKRPESFLGELPNPTPWANRGSAAGWPTSSSFSVTERNPQRHPPRASTDSAVPTVSTRTTTRSSRSFSIPLRINTIVPPDPHAIEGMTISSEAVNSAVRFPDSITRPDSQMSGRSTPVESTCRRDPSSGRLSLFPSSTPPLGSAPSNFTHSQRPRLSVATSMHHENVSAPSGLRPSSVQVRADHNAAYQESSRFYPNSAHPTSEPQGFPIVAPIKQLRVSRSIAAMERTRPEVSGPQFHPTEQQPPQHFNFTTRRLVDDHYRPLVSQLHSNHMRSQSPARPSTGNDSFPPHAANSRPSSRSSRRLTRDRPPHEMRRSVSLVPNMRMPVHIDLSMPILPPPAPPPSAPLPALPPAARSSSRLSERAKSPDLLCLLREFSGNETRLSSLGQAGLRKFVPGTTLEKAIEARLSRESKVAPELEHQDEGRDGRSTPVPETVLATGRGIGVAAA